MWSVLIVRDLRVKHRVDDGVVGVQFDQDRPVHRCHRDCQFLRDPKTTISTATMIIIGIQGIAWVDGGGGWFYSMIIYHEFSESDEHRTHTQHHCCWYYDL